MPVILLAFNSIAQKVNTVKSATNNSKVVKKTFPVKGKLVTVNDWNGIGNLYMNNYWVSNKNTIINQIGAAEFEMVKANSDENKWPNEFRERFDESGNDNTAERFKNLKLYQIAAFTNTVNGRKFDDMIILRVPFSENKNALPKSNWESDVYFILKASSVL
jgi:hypothetical protein